jgi:hypothetical protein
MNPNVPEPARAMDLVEYAVDAESLLRNALALGFRPAFLDTATFSIHLSRYADGQPAPFHLLDGLPDEVVVARSVFGSRILAAKATLVPGFERKGFFYTAPAAARAAAEWTCANAARA